VDAHQFTVERGKVLEFARATRLAAADFEVEDASIPPTFLTAAALWRGPGNDPVADLGFAFDRILHAEEEYVFHGPPPQVGTTLTVLSSVGERWERTGSRGGRMRFCRIVSEFTDESGRLVAEQRSTVVETGVATGGGGG
jgi:hypothetical protein